MSDDRETLEALRAKAEELTRQNSGQTVIQAMMPPPTDSERAVHRIEKVAWLLAGLLLSGLIVVWQQSIRINELSARLDGHSAWAREESNIWRGYVWTGKVPPLNRYPKEQAAK